MRVVVGQGSCGVATGAKKTAAELEKQIAAKGLDIPVSVTGCVGTCYLEPIVDVYDDNEELTRYVKVQPDKVEKIVEEHLAGGKPVAEDAISDEDKQFIIKQQRVVLRNCGVINPENIEDYAMRRLIASGKTAAVAESITGGLVGDQMTNTPGASSAFLGGMIVYTDEIKNRLLGVDADVLREHGAVSREVAVQMAERVREKFGADIGISLTGLAGPGDDGVHTVGTVFVALAVEGATYVRRLYKDKWGRERIKHAAANHAFDMLRRYLDDLPVEIDEENQ